MNNAQQRNIGIALSYMTQLIHIITSIIYTPVMLRLLGQSEYGLYQLVISVTSYLNLLSFGFSSSYIRFYSRAKASGEKDAVARLNGMYFTVFFVISIVSALCGMGMLCNTEAIFGSGLSPQEYSKARILMILMVFNVTISFPSTVYSSIISAQEQFIFLKTVDLLQGLFSPLLTLPLLIMGYGSVGMVFIITILNVGRLAANIYYCLRKLHAKFLFRGFRWKTLQEMWIFTFFIFINQIVDQIIWNADKFLLGRMMGTTAVAVYGLGSNLNSLYTQLSTTISGVFVPRVNEIVSQSDDNWALTRLFTRIGRIQFMLLSLVLTGFVFFGRQFIIWWGGAEYEQSYDVALWLIASQIIPLIQNMGIEIQRAKNMHQMRSLVYLAMSIFKVVLSIQLIKLWGVVGAAIGTAIAVFAGEILFMNVYYHKRIGLNMISFWKSVSSFVPTLLVALAAGVLITRVLDIHRISQFCLGIVLYTLVYCGALYTLSMEEEEKAQIKALLNKLRRKG